MCSHLSLGYRMTSIQTTLGMGNDIYLITLLDCTDFLNSLLYVFAVLFNRCKGFLIAIINGSPVFGQHAWNPAPVIDVFQITKANAMQHEQRISGFTYL